MRSSQISVSIVPGSLIGGRYTVDHALGKGGMGSVYAVSDVSTGRRLALKFLHRQAAVENGPAAALFQREFHTLAHLRHPRVIQVYDYGVDAGRPFYTMEMLDGSDLRDLAPLPWRRACEVLRDVASSLALLHSRRLLHRDVGPRNVRCTRDGQAKLIDFGTMAPMGLAKEVAGTPPYMPPEAVHAQTLDARTDLYALGALAYWTLTGYDAYPARDVRELSELWPRPILPPSAIIAGIPEALDALVMSLLSLDQQARPSHAAEVIERLTAVGGLDPGEHLDVARAYLSSPMLVGHGEVLIGFHKRLVRAVRGRGSALLVQGASGLGRSRLLQALVLEAKLNGVQVLSADAKDTPRGELGVARAWIDALIESIPDVALSTFREHAPILGGIFSGVYRKLDHPPPLSSFSDHREQLARVLQSIRDWLVAVSQRRPLMIAVDDADHADEWSLVCLTLLAGDARTEHLVVAASVERADGHKALDLLAVEAFHIELTKLDAAQTALLLQSVFGDVPHVQCVADWVHALSDGSPRTIMELAQYLVDHGVAKYERGSFTLPETLRGQALPKSIEQAIEQHLAELSPSARTLAESLAQVTEHGPLEFDELEILSEVENSAGTYGAVEELVAAQVLIAAGSTHHLRQNSLAQALRKNLSADRAKTIHLRLANLYDKRTARSDSDLALLLLRAYHRFLGGDLQGCSERLERMGYATDVEFGRTPEAITMFEACLAYAKTHGVSPARLYPLRRTLLRLSATADPALIKYAGPTLEQLCRDSGRIFYDQIADAPNHQARIRQCIAHARYLYDRTDSSLRGLDPVAAVYELGLNSLALVETYLVRNDSDALSELSITIAPFRALSPMFELLFELARHAFDALEGKDVSARRMKLLAKLELPLDGFAPGSQQTLRSVLTYWLGVDEAVVGNESALDHAAALERQPQYAPLGAQIRSIYHLFGGNESEAELWQKRREMLALQSPFADLTSTRGVSYEAVGNYLCGSVLGMRRVLGETRKLAARYPGWKRELRNVEAMYALLRGEPHTALLFLEGEVSGPTQVQAWIALGDAGAALAIAEQSLARDKQERDHPMHLLRLRALRNLALSATGEGPAAAKALQRDIADAERSGVAGMLICGMHEAAAKIAIDMDDRDAFRSKIQRLDAIYGRGGSGLRARYEQLGVIARRAMLSMPPTAAEPQTFVQAEQSAGVTTQLDSAFSREQRLSRALSLLAQRAKSSRGFLYGMQPSGLKLLAVLGDGPPPDGMVDMLEFFLRAELESADAVANTATGTFTAAPDMIAWVNDGQSLYYPVLLSCISGAHRVVGGVAVLALPVQRDPNLPADFVSDISRSLLEAGDVTGADAAS